MNCPHNNMVTCETQKKCQTCGWNPDVSECRVAMLRERLEAERDAKERQEQDKDGEM